jgi:hypothetical protein
MENGEKQITSLKSSKNWWEKKWRQNFQTNEKT